MVLFIVKLKENVPFRRCNDFLKKRHLENTHFTVFKTIKAKYVMFIFDLI